MDELTYVVFKVGNERYGLPIDKVERILAAQPVTRLPKTPKMLVGLFEMSGECIPVIDAQLRFEIEPQAVGKNFIVTSCEAGRYALRVDSVDGIEEFDDTSTDTPHKILGGTDPFLKAIGRRGDELTALLDPEYVLPQELKKKVAKIAA